MILGTFNLLATAICAGPLLSLVLIAGKTAGIVDLTWWYVTLPYLIVASGIGTIVLLVTALAIALNIETGPL